MNSHKLLLLPLALATTGLAFCNDSDETYDSDLNPKAILISIDGEQPTAQGEATPFDLNADGAAEEAVFLPSSGSGFVVADNNQNGAVDDGSELLGATTGSAFEELSAYDSNGDGWVSTDDDSYYSLGIWMSVDGGEGQVFSLEELGLEALVLIWEGLDNGEQGGSLPKLWWRHRLHGHRGARG